MRVREQQRTEKGKQRRTEGRNDEGESDGWERTIDGKSAMAQR